MVALAITCVGYSGLLAAIAHNYITTLARLLGPSGARAIVSEALS